MGKGIGWGVGALGRGFESYDVFSAWGAGGSGAGVGD